LGSALGKKLFAGPWQIQKRVEFEEASVHHERKGSPGN